MAINPKIDKAMWWLRCLSADASLGEGDLLAKTADVANRLLAQCCITGLKDEHGWSNSELARQISARGANTSRDRIGEWLSGANTASPERLAILWELYQAAASYRRAAATATEYSAE